MVVERKEDFFTMFSTLKHMVAQADPFFLLHNGRVGLFMNITLSTALRPHFHGIQPVFYSLWFQPGVFKSEDAGSLVAPWWLAAVQVINPALSM